MKPNRLLDPDDLTNPQFSVLIREMHYLMNVKPNGYDTVYGKNRSFIEGTKHWEYCQLISQIPVRKDMMVLDAGCSRSIFPIFLAHHFGAKVVGIDNATDDRYRLDKKLGYKFGYDVKYIQCDLRQTEFPDHYFDTTFCVSVLEHVKNPKRGMDELIRITKPGGKIGITTDFVPKGKPVPITGAFTKKQIKENFIQRPGVELIGELSYGHDDWEKYCKKINKYFRSVRMHTAASIVLRRI